MVLSYKALDELMSAFPTEESCIKYLEYLRWSKGIVCPLCLSSRKFHRITRGNIYKCGDCEKSFSVRKRTIFEESRLSLRKWFAAFWLITSNRKGISHCQLAHEVGVSQKTALFMLDRLNEVAVSMSLKGRAIKVDETYVDNKVINRHTKKKLKRSHDIVAKQNVIGGVKKSSKVKPSFKNTKNRNNIKKFILN